MLGGFFLCGTDFTTENEHLKDLPLTMGLPMDLRSREQWEELLRVSFGLCRVASLEINNTIHSPSKCMKPQAGTLFVWGYNDS